MWLLVPGAPLLDNSDDMLIDFQHNFSVSNDFNIVWGLAQQFQNIRTSGTSIPFDVNANYTGIYSQFDYSINNMFKFVASARADFASIHSTQFSPRLAIVMTPVENHTFRLSAGRSFQRPNYSELYRSTPDAPAFGKDGRPINFANVEKKIEDTLAALSGKPVDINLNLNATRARALGNDKLNVEQNVSFEFGYKGIISRNLYFTVDAYYSILNDFITNFLPGANPNIPAWEPTLGDSLTQYTAKVKSMVMAELNPRDKQRLATYNGLPTFVVSNTNVGKVEQYGVDVSANYYFTDELLFGANYSYYNSKVVESSLVQPLLSNTSPHTLNMSLSYIKQKSWDMSVSFRYSEQFEWLAGTYQGNVPVFATLNFNGGIYIIDKLQAGFNVYNTLNRKQYQIFGGTYLPRTFTVKLSYEI
jgi:iron complex outermembrane receptor protein